MARYGIVILRFLLYGTPHGHQRARARGWTPHGSAQKKGAQAVHHKPQAPRHRPQEQVAAGNAFPRGYYTLGNGGKSTDARDAAACVGRCVPSFLYFGKNRRPGR